MKKVVALSILYLLISSVSGGQSIDTAFVLVEKDLIPEGITYSAKHQSFFIGSIYKNKIVHVRGKHASDFVKTGQYGSKAYLGLKVDEKRNALWGVCGGDVTASEPWKTALFQFDLITGELKGKFPLRDSISGFNDLAIADGGSIYLTDTSAGAIYVKDPDQEFIVPFLPKKTFDSPNGIVYTKGVLIVSDANGLWRVDLKTKRVSSVAGLRSVPLNSIDGLSLYKGKHLIAIQNGDMPRKVLALTCDDLFTKIVEASTLDYHDTGRRYYSPTTGVVVGNRYYFLSNAQVRSLTADGKIFPLSELEPIYVKSIELHLK